MDVLDVIGNKAKVTDLVDFMFSVQVAHNVHKERRNWKQNTCHMYRTR